MHYFGDAGVFIKDHPWRHGPREKKGVNDGREETPRNLENASSETHVIDQRECLEWYQ